MLIRWLRAIAELSVPQDVSRCGGALGRPPAEAHDRGVRVELLVVPDCPNQAAAGDLVRGLLDGMGLTETQVPVRVITSEVEAARRGFTGSPTILIDGADPFAERGAIPGMACRVYTTPGGLAGVPDSAALQAALRAAAGLT